MKRSTPGLPSITNSRSSLKLTFIESVMPSSHLILCRAFFHLPWVPASIRVFSSESTLHMRWPSTGLSALASFLPKNTQDWSPLEWTCWISIRELPWIFLSLIMRLCHWDHLIVLQDKNTRIHNKKIVIVDSPIYYWITMLYNRI